jgi:hypothetical protein
MQRYMVLETPSCDNAHPMPRILGRPEVIGMLSPAVIERGDKAIHGLVSSSLTSYQSFDSPAPHFERVG